MPLNQGHIDLVRLWVEKYQEERARASGTGKAPDWMLKMIAADPRIARAVGRVPTAMSRKDQQRLAILQEYMKVLQDR
jgi:hypothetical protein